MYFIGQSALKNRLIPTDEFQIVGPPKAALFRDLCPGATFFYNDQLFYVGANKVYCVYHQLSEPIWYYAKFLGFEPVWKVDIICESSSIGINAEINKKQQKLLPLQPA